MSALRLLCGVLTLALCACGGGGSPDEGPEGPEPPAGWEAVSGVPRQPAAEVLLSDASGLIVAAGDRVYRSTDGAQWTALPRLPGGREAAALGQSGGRYWVGTYNEQGVYRWAPGEGAWQSASSGLSGAGARTVLGFASRGTQLYAATAGAGLFRDDLDDAAGWVADREGIPFNLSWNVESVAEQQGRVIAGAGGNGKLYVQDVGGTAWHEVSYDAFGGDALFLWALLGRNGAWIGGGNRGLYRSGDAGESWTRILSFERNALRVRFAVPDSTRVLAMVSAGSATQLLQSVDGGASWQTAWPALSGVQGFDVAAFGGYLYLAHAGGLWRTLVAEAAA